jgi:predicted thioesterase
VSLEPGLTHSAEFVVADPLLTDLQGRLDARVLSTPGMIHKMERCAMALVAEALGPDAITVGFEVCVKHVAAAREGARCTAHATLREVADGRKLRFDVEVREGERTIGVGTHERRLVERSRFEDEATAGGDGA